MIDSSAWRRMNGRFGHRRLAWLRGYPLDVVVGAVVAAIFAAVGVAHLEWYFIAVYVFLLALASGFAAHAVQYRKKVREMTSALWWALAFAMLSLAAIPTYHFLLDPSATLDSPVAMLLNTNEPAAILPPSPEPGAPPAPLLPPVVGLESVLVKCETRIPGDGGAWLLLNDPSGYPERWVPGTLFHHPRGREIERIPDC